MLPIARKIAVKQPVKPHPAHMATFPKALGIDPSQQRPEGAERFAETHRSVDPP